MIKQETHNMSGMNTIMTKQLVLQFNNGGGYRIMKTWGLGPGMGTWGKVCLLTAKYNNNSHIEELPLLND